MLDRSGAEKMLDKKPGKRLRGQALAEYAIIAAFILFAIIGILTLIGPAIGNIFSNTVVNAVQGNGSVNAGNITPYETYSPDVLQGYMTAVASYVPPPRIVATNTLPPQSFDPDIREVSVAITATPTPWPSK